MSRGLNESTRTRTMKTSSELPAGAGKIPVVTRRNRRQLVPAEIFGYIPRYFYLRISLPAPFTGNYARASFTVHVTHAVTLRMHSASDRHCIPHPQTHDKVVASNGSPHPKKKQIKHHTKTRAPLF